MDFHKINIAISENNFSTLTITELEKLIEEFPYCSNFKIALSKIHNTNNHYQLNKSIKEAAPFVNNRSAFFNFLFTETLKVTTEKVEKEIEEFNTKEQTQKKELSPDNEAPVAKTEISITPEIEKKSEEFEETITKGETELGGKNENEDLAEDVIKELKTNKEKVEENLEKDFEKEKMLKELEKQIISSAVSTSIIKEASEPIEEIEFEDEPSPSFNPTSKNTFSGWLKNISQNKIDQKTTQEKRQLIEKFIQNDPQITPKQTAFFSVAEKAKLSLAEDEAFVTETLAKIYAQQGNTSKAIKAYEILMLKNPEKKTLFAARIKELKISVKK